MGDKICDWFCRELPGLTQWIGGMSASEAVVFAIGLMVFAYLIYAVAYNIYLNIAGYEYYEYEIYEPWMDRDALEDYEGW